MKSALNAVINKNEPLSYPCLRMRSTSAYVVLFTNEDRGTVVWLVEGSPYSLGYYCCGWAKASDNTVWKPCPAEITLIP